MNAVAIILGIIIVILIYVLYKYFTNTATPIQTSIVSLKSPPSEITKLSSPTSNQYAYGIWVYVSTWDNNVAKTIFEHQNAMKVYLDKNSPKLKVKVTMSTGSDLDVFIVDSFPLQKWVYIIASMDNQFLDVYLDGKLVKSTKLTDNNNTALPKIPVDGAKVIIGNGQNGAKWDAYVTYFNRWTTSMDPGTAWQYYMKGNGQNSVLGGLKNYGVQMQLTQNNVVASTYTLL
jgi:hypothetical protein